MIDKATLETLGYFADRLAAIYNDPDLTPYIGPVGREALLAQMVGAAEAFEARNAS